MSHASRRRFLKDCPVFTAGVVTGSFFLKLVGAFAGVETEKSSGAEERVRQLGLKLRKVTEPAAPFDPAVRVGNMLYVSGHGHRKSEGGLVKGKVSKPLSLEQHRAAARLVGLDMLSTIRGALGSLAKMNRMMKVAGMVHSINDFTQHPQVINGFSELMIDIFGEQAGKDARSAVGMSGLSFGIPVEMEANFQVCD